jgi:hypothetical protein
MSYSPTLKLASTVTPRALLLDGASSPLVPAAVGASIMSSSWYGGTGVGVEIFHQAGGTEAIQALHNGRVAHIHLPFLQHHRHRHHQGKVLHIAFVVVGHGEHGAIAIPGDNHLGCLVVKAGIGPGHVKATEGPGRRNHHKNRHDCRQGDEYVRKSPIFHRSTCLKPQG